MKRRTFLSLKHVLMPGATARASLRERYRYFRALLNHNRDALHAMAELEQLYYSDRPIDLQSVAALHQRLNTQVAGIVSALNQLTDDAFAGLRERQAALQTEMANTLAPRARHAERIADHADIIPLEAVSPDMGARVGGKASGLALLKNTLELPVPEGFVVTAGAVSRFLATHALRERIQAGLAELSPNDPAGLVAGSERIRQWILATPVPDALAASLREAYENLEARTHAGVRIAMRSSAVGEDGDASFAGQYATVLNVAATDVLSAFQQVVASKYSSQAITYRQLLGLDDEATPMCVVGLVMVDARASGVLYTTDPAAPDAGRIKISALWGLGEQLVGGDATPDTFVLDKVSGQLVERVIAHKSQQLVALAAGGTRLEDIRADQAVAPSLGDAVLHALHAGAVRIEAHEHCAQDIEWAVDSADQVFFLQTRPLHLDAPADASPALDLTGYEILLDTGTAAARGFASGPVHVASDDRLTAAIPDGAILVTHAAAPAFAAAMGRIAALVTDVGSVTSHLASVAREFGIPAIVNAGNATMCLTDGEEVTVVAGMKVAVVRGRAAALADRMRPARKRYVGSQVHRRLRAFLDIVVPLNLTDCQADHFSVAGCRTVHDIIRFCHEHAMRAMFSGSTQADASGGARKVKTHLPLAVYVIDLGGGLEPSSQGKTVVPDAFASLPLRAIWRGFAHPGISWEGTLNFAGSRFMSLMASLATSELGPEPGGDSYVLMSHDYMNFSAKFGYHFATVDALCSDDAGHNYIAMQFAGGAGNFFGRSLRIRFLGEVLKRLGFQVTLQGDLIEAAYGRRDKAATESRLDQLGRLLASSRLLDLTLSDEDDVLRLADAFMAGDYAFLKPRDPGSPSRFYTQHGHWECRHRDGRACLFQSGMRQSARRLSGTLGKALGETYSDLVERIGAYFYFPLAIAKDSETANAHIKVDVFLEGGRIDRAGGLVFGLRNAANYYVFRINALENNAILFAYVDGKRSELARAKVPLQTGCWHALEVFIDERHIDCRIDARQACTHVATAPVSGHVGLWTKADSATWFGPLTVNQPDGTRIHAH